MACRDFGIVESTTSADLHSVATFCRCSAGAEREEAQCPCDPSKGVCQRPLTQRDCSMPLWRVNLARQKLLKRFPQPVANAIGLGPDEYAGEF
jgi:hypothetical protein